jgi:hypothetical protein
MFYYFINKGVSLINIAKSKVKHWEWRAKMKKKLEDLGL